MREEFECPDDFLSYLQEIHAKPYTGNSIQDQEFHRRTTEELQKFGIELPTGVVGGLQVAIDETYQKIIHAMSPARQNLVNECIAAGVLEHGEAHAFILKSPDGKFAILLSSGLATFLHKIIKLHSALTNPSSVTYCNRIPAKHITREIIISYLDEMIEYFRQYLVPRGPMIKLEEEYSARSSSMLMHAEMFILCHELGHFLNGDLEDEKNYSALPPGIPGVKYKENINHEKEFKADHVGYQLYLDTISSMGKKLPPQVSLAPIMFTFDLFYRLAGGESSSHPHPHDRIVRIVNDFISSETAGKTLEALQNPELLPDIFPIATP